jgi:V-type H+-transporting ATPase subunit C
MPSDLSYWLVSSPLKDGDPNIMVEEVRDALGPNVTVAAWEIPELKVSDCPKLITHTVFPYGRFITFHIAA